MKKLLITENQYKHIKNYVNEEVDGNTFKSEVKIDINYRGKISHLVEDISAPNINLSFLIDTEYRSWGIKSISLYNIQGPSEIEIEVTHYTSDNDEDPQTKVVLLKLNWDISKIEEENGMGRIGIGDEITIDITENENNDLICTQITIPVNSL